MENLILYVLYRKNSLIYNIKKEKLWGNPDCELKTRGVPKTDVSLGKMVKAAKK